MLVQILVLAIRFAVHDQRPSFVGAPRRSLTTLIRSETTDLLLSSWGSMRGPAELDQPRKPAFAVVAARSSTSRRRWQRFTE